VCVMILGIRRSTMNGNASERKKWSTKCEEQGQMKVKVEECLVGGGGPANGKLFAQERCGTGSDAPTLGD
jgi:hypothetical protein